MTIKTQLRNALIAPPGYKVVVADKSQIECRLNAYMCGETNLVDMFRNKLDPYSVLATSIFNQPVDKNTLNGVARFIGKQGELGLGFGCGWNKFYNMVIRKYREMGIDTKPLLEIWTEDLAVKSVSTYRATHKHIVASWGKLGKHISTAWLGHTAPVMWGAVEIGHGYVMGPNGLKMQYANPRWDQDREHYLYDYGKGTYKMYGPKMLENIIQFLARINVMHDALRISDRGFTFCLTSHDELAWVVPNERVEECMAVALEEMTRPPSWAKGIPLAVEVGVGQSYGAAK